MKIEEKEERGRAAGCGGVGVGGLQRCAGLVLKDSARRSRSKLLSVIEKETLASESAGRENGGVGFGRGQGRWLGGCWLESAGTYGCGKPGISPLAQVRNKTHLSISAHVVRSLKACLRRLIK